MTKSKKPYHVMREMNEMYDMHKIHESKDEKYNKKNKKTNFKDSAVFVDEDYPELKIFENDFRLTKILIDTKTILFNHRNDFTHNGVTFSISSDKDPVILNDFWKIKELGYLFGKLHTNIIANNLIPELDALEFERDWMYDHITGFYDDLDDVNEKPSDWEIETVKKLNKEYKYLRLQIKEKSKMLDNTFNQLVEQIENIIKHQK